MTARILVVEDDVTSRSLMAYLLRSAGYQPEEAGDGALGLAAAQRECPDLIAMDLQMPVMDGIQVVEALRSDPVLRGVPVVAVTAMAMVGDKEKVLAAGFHGYITKPIEPERFVTQLEEFLPVGVRATARSTEPEAVTRVREHRAPAPRSGTDVLVVDDTPGNQDLLRSILEPSGYTVRTAGGGLEALVAARRARPGLVLSDIRMSAGDGYQLLAALRADDDLRDVPFVLISSSVLTDEERVEAERAGADAFVNRPIDPEHLISRIDAVLSSAREV